MSVEEIITNSVSRTRNTTASMAEIADAIVADLSKDGYAIVPLSLVIKSEENE